MSKKKNKKPRKHPAKEARIAAAIYASEIKETKKALKGLDKNLKPSRKKNY